MSLASSCDGDTCPACKGPLEDAVTATCGHTFCRRCLTRQAKMRAHSSSKAQPSSKARSSTKALFCVFCKEKEEKEEKEALLVPVPLGPLGETYCQEHGEKIYFFCENDAELLCVFCREGPSHQSHTVGFLDEAIQPYRDRLRSRLEALSTERDELKDAMSREDQKLQVLVDQIENKKQQMEAAFEKLKEELRKQQHLLLTRLGELEQQIQKERGEYTSKVSEEVARLGVQVKELEDKCQQPASELLHDVRINQNRYEVKTSINPEAISPDLIKKIRNLHRKILPLPEMMRDFSENLVRHLGTDSEVQITLDLQTTSRSLTPSESRRSARNTRKKNVPDSPLRSEGLPAVLGSPGLPSRSHRQQVLEVAWRRGRSQSSPSVPPPQARSSVSSPSEKVPP